MFTFYHQSLHTTLSCLSQAYGSHSCNTVPVHGVWDVHGVVVAAVRVPHLGFPLIVDQAENVFLNRNRVNAELTWEWLLGCGAVDGGVFRGEMMEEVGVEGALVGWTNSVKAGEDIVW
jgi:hypothetical protein